MRLNWLPCTLLMLFSFLALTTFASCTDPSREMRQDKAYSAFEKLLIFEMKEYTAGRMTLDDFVSDFRKNLDDLKASERTDQPSGTSLATTLEIALGSSTLAGTAVHFLRNMTRANDIEEAKSAALDEATQRFEQRLSDLQSRSATAPKVQGSA